jgi:hypothetical protein
LFSSFQGTAAYDAVLALQPLLLDIRFNGTTLLAGGRLPDDGLDMILGVDTERISQGKCLPTLVEGLKAQAHATLPQGKALSFQ